MPILLTLLTLAVLWLVLPRARGAIFQTIIILPAILALLASLFVLYLLFTEG
jgi:hypothetical protein